MNRLSEWLDPENRGITSIMGRNGILCKKGLAASVTKVNICTPNSASVQIFTGSAFSAPITFDLVGSTSAIAYSFNPVTVLPGNAATLFISSKQMVGAIESKIKIRGISGEDTVFTELQLVLNKHPIKSSLKIQVQTRGLNLH